MATSPPPPAPHLFVLLLLLSISISSAGAATSSSSSCSSQTFPNDLFFSTCNDLPHLSASLHWTFTSSNSTLSLAFLCPPASPSGWVSWAINPAAPAMSGSQALLAFRRSNGTIGVQTYNISGYGPIAPSKIAYDVPHSSAEFSGGVIRIFATLKLPFGTQKVNQVWQTGSSVTGDLPGRHEFNPENLNSKGTLDLLSGQSTIHSSDSTIRKKNIHGILNGLSWGIMLPIGAIFSRHVKTFESADPAWFYLHVTCQFSAYVIGVAGWATGLQLGSKSKGVTYTDHRNIGIALFCFGTLQVFALFLRPKKDHKYRVYWNFYHHSIGYSTIILSIINIFKGFGILRPEKQWKTAYISIISVVGAIAVLMEVITWIIVLRRKSSNSTKPYEGGNGVQEYDGRP